MTALYVSQNIGYYNNIFLQKDKVLARSDIAIFQKSVFFVLFYVCVCVCVCVTVMFYFAFKSKDCTNSIANTSVYQKLTTVN